MRVALVEQCSKPSKNKQVGDKSPTCLFTTFCIQMSKCVISTIIVK